MAEKVHRVVLIFALFLPYLGNILTVFVIMYRLFAKKRTGLNKQNAYKKQKKYFVSMVFLFSLLTGVLTMVAVDYMTGWIGVCDYMAVVGRRIDRVVYLYTFIKTSNRHYNISGWNAIKISTAIIGSTLKIHFLNKINKTVKKVPGTHNQYEISYVIHGKLYKMIITPKKGPTHVAFIFDEDNNDVSDTVFPYMGPRYDFHHCHHITPKFLGFKELKFVNVDGEEKKYSEDDILAI